MNKLNNLIMFYPMILNLLMIFIMSIPSKINKFHPITFMMILILMTFLITLKINFLNKSLISFILFLTMIGGLMIIFMYITSLANNELFSLNYKLYIMNILKMIPLMILFLMMYMYYFQIYMNIPIYSFQFSNLFDSNNKFINIIYKESNNKVTYFMMIYLYFSMICIMNICYKMKIPLRQILF